MFRPYRIATNKVFSANDSRSTASTYTLKLYNWTGSMLSASGYQLALAAGTNGAATALDAFTFAAKSQDGASLQIASIPYNL